MGWKIWELPHETLLISMLPKHLILAKVGKCLLISSTKQTKGKTGINRLHLARITPSKRFLSKNLTADRCAPTLPGGWQWCNTAMTSGDWYW